MAKRLDDSRPPSEQVAGHLRDAIQRGEFAPHDRLPSQRQLAQEYGIAQMTARRALDLLAEEGLVVAQPGRGHFVREQSATPASPADPESATTVEARLAETERLLADTREELRRANERIDLLEGTAAASAQPDLALEPPEPAVDL